MQIGDKVPEVLGVDQEGREWRMSDFSGRKVILYFYPKDSTPGCTAEACSLRDHFGELQALGYDILGVSADSAESHQKFAAAQSLPFPLIADTDKRLIEAMGVWGEKNRYGRITVGLLRTTFLIDEQGCVERIFTPRTDSHENPRRTDSESHRAQSLRPIFATHRPCRVTTRAGGIENRRTRILF